MIKKYKLKNAQRDLPSRLKTDNKTRGGKCLIVAGSKNQWGAGILCAQAAARSGAGYTYIFDPQSAFPIHKNPDFLILKSIKDIDRFDAVAFGPGFHHPALIKKLIHQLKKHPEIQVVLDAEAINTLAKIKKPLRLPSHWVLTPHEGELARLLKVSSAEIKTNRKKSVQKAQKTWGGVFVLKGNQTLVADELSISEIASGNSALAKAGTGDVLTGIIAALLSQKLPAQKASCLGAFIHGAIADRWIQQKRDHLSLLASDLISMLPETLMRIRKK